MDVNASAQLITATAQLITAPVQPPATGVVVYTALFRYSNCVSWMGGLINRLTHPITDMQEHISHPKSFFYREFHGFVIVYVLLLLYLLLFP